MNGKDTFKLKVQNLSCFKQSVRLLYTGSGENDIGYYRNDRALKQLITSLMQAVRLGLKMVRLFPMPLIQLLM